MFNIIVNRSCRSYYTVCILSPSLGQKVLLLEPDPYPEILLRMRSYFASFFSRLYLYQNNKHDKVRYLAILRKKAVIALFYYRNHKS